MEVDASCEGRVWGEGRGVCGGRGGVRVGGGVCVGEGRGGGRVPLLIKYRSKGLASFMASSRPLSLSPFSLHFHTSLHYDFWCLCGLPGNGVREFTTEIRSSVSLCGILLPFLQYHCYSVITVPWGIFKWFSSNKKKL